MLAILIMNRELAILCVEDDENDVWMMLRVFKKLGLSSPVHVCRDGEEARAYIQGSGTYGDRARFQFPNLIISDLKMPKMGGFEMLEWLRTETPYAALPVIVLTSSKEEADIHRAYQLGANSYAVKPRDLTGLENFIKATVEYWVWCESPQPVVNR